MPHHGCNYSTTALKTDADEVHVSVATVPYKSYKHPQKSHLQVYKKVYRFGYDGMDMCDGQNNIADNITEKVPMSDLYKDYKLY